MKEHNIHILALQETKQKETSEENNEDYTTYFSSDPTQHKTLNKNIKYGPLNQQE